MIELVSVHIPKAAGNSFRTLLRSVYGWRGVQLDYNLGGIDALYHRDAAAWRLQVDQQVKNFSPRVRVLHGHFRAFKYLPYFDSARWIVWIREPLERLYSMYRYWMKHPPAVQMVRERFARIVSFYDFVEFPYIRNEMTSYLEGKALSEFFFVGLTHQMDADVRELGRRLGWPNNTRIARHNCNPQSITPGTLEMLRADKALMARLRAYQARDYELYERALELRRTQRLAA